MCYCLDCGRRISCITLETDGLCDECRFSEDAMSVVSGDFISLEELREKIATQEEKEEEENDD